MKKITRYLISAYIIIVIIKILLISVIPAPIEFADYYIYSKMAQSFISSGNFNVHNMAANIFPPLYPIFISPAFLFSDSKISYLFIKIINAFILGSIIFPAYLLSREFLSGKKSFLASILVSLIPSTFAFSSFIMSENLFYPLYMFSIYFIYKSYKEKSFKWDILAGVFIGLSILTRHIALSLILTIILSLIFYFMIKRENRIVQLKRKTLMGVSALIIISPWLIRNIIAFGFSLKAILGIGGSVQVLASISQRYTLAAFSTTFIFYIAFLILSTGVIFFLLSISVIKRMFRNKDYFNISIIFLSSFFSSVMLAANHNSGVVKYTLLYSWFTGKFVGRYIDHLIPLMIILGIIGFQYIKEDKRLLKYFALSSSLILLFSSQIIFMSLFPVNNISLTYLGIFNYIINLVFLHIESSTPQFNILTLIIFSILFFILPFIILNLTRIKIKKLMSLIMIFFFLASLVSIATVYFESNRSWYNSEQTRLGLFFNEHNKDKSSKVLFDEDNCGKISKDKQDDICSDTRFYTISGFWMNSNIRIGNTRNIEGIGYIVSKKELGYEKIYDTKKGIFLYKLTRD